jgi:hypothetical protein
MNLTTCSCGHEAFQHFLMGRCALLNCGCQEYDKEQVALEEACDED